MSEQQAHKTLSDAVRKVLAEGMGESYLARPDATNNDFWAPVRAFSEEFAYASLWTRDGLDRKQRSMITVAMLCALNRPHELKIHLVGALNNGCSKTELREIFTQEAEKKGIAASADYRAQMELARQSILIRELFEDFKKKNPVSDAEAKAEYDKFVAANSGKEFKARHILVEKESEAKDIIARLKKGAKFDEIAKKQSKDPGSGANGGDLDWANPRSYVPEFTEALLKLNKGQLTDTPVKSQFGYHIIRLDDVREAELPKFADIKPQIAQQLQQHRLQQYQEKLRSSAKVE